MSADNNELTVCEEEEADSCFRSDEDLYGVSVSELVDDFYFST